MSLTTGLPVVAAILFLAMGLLMALRPPPAVGPATLPGALALLFAGLTALAVTQEGLLGFWPEHVRNLWGTQIWVDLLLALGVSWVLLLPRLRAAGMVPWRWFVLIACSGSIGLLLTLARLWQREQLTPRVA